MAGETEGYKQSIVVGIIFDCGDDCPLCKGGIYGMCPCKDKHDALIKSSRKDLSRNIKVYYCVDGMTCDDEKLGIPFNDKKMSLVDYYSFEFIVSQEDFLEIKLRLEECSLFFGARNRQSQSSAFFHYIGPRMTQFKGTALIMTFASIEMFYADNRIEISNNSHTRALNMIKVLKYVILGNSYGNEKNIDVTDMTIEVLLLSSVKDKPEIKRKASELATQFEDFINGTVVVKIDKKCFDYRKCSYCGKRNSQEEKLLVCSACKGKNKALYCSKECQKGHWKFHKETAKH